MTAQQKVAAGAAAVALGSWLLYQGYEGSGRKRPFWTKVLPGV
jgi:dihydroorotate dehydrogenase